MTELTTTSQNMDKTSQKYRICFYYRDHLSNVLILPNVPVVHNLILIMLFIYDPSVLEGIAHLAYQPDCSYNFGEGGWQ